METRQEVYCIRPISDKEKADKLRQAVINNDGYCPCKIQKTDDTKCMCKEFRESSGEGVCHCGLYIRMLKYD